MILSINPMYYCNFRCEFCYLTHDQLSDRKLLPLDKLSEMLAQIDEPIEHVDLYGGELGLLTKEYWNNLLDLLALYRVKNINLNTNLSMVNAITTDPRVYTSVSFDFSAREMQSLVFRNMARLEKEFSILMLASPQMLTTEVDEVVNLLNTLGNLVSVEVKPYSKNQSNQLDVSYTEFEIFVKKLILNSQRKFEVVNEFLLQDTLTDSRVSFSNDHVYITPNGKFGVLEFDEADNEYFKEYDTFDEYREWCDIEQQRVSENEFCSKCDYYGKCLSEHLRDVKDIDNSCNGFVNLINWYKESGRMES